MNMIPVLAVPAIDPGSARIEMTLPEGLNIAQIVKVALPCATSLDISRCRVSLVSERGSVIILVDRWHLVRPRRGVRVVIRIIPGKSVLKSVLSIVVAIAAVALAVWLGPALGVALGFTGVTAATIGGALITVGVNLLGSLLINALIPPVKPDDERRSTYSISGWRNALNPDGAVPEVLGQIRYAPPFAARPWTEIVGDWQYIRSLFNFGSGPVELTDFRIGDTSIADFKDIEIEVREGLPTDPPVSLYPRQIVEESIGVELARPIERNQWGGFFSSRKAIETPIVRSTGADAQGASIILAFPGGLVRFNDEGEKRQHSVRVRIEQRLVQADEWHLVTNLDVSASKIETFYRQYTWQFPSRGRWQIRATMMTDESDDNKIQQRTMWAGLQTLRPEYPLNYSYPLALVSVRIKATHQLSGALDNFTAMARRVCLDWDYQSKMWVKRATSNPASLYRYVLQCPANPKPVSDSGIDLDVLADWHDFCRLKSLHYNRVLDQTGQTMRNILTEVAAAGRASPRHNGMQWGVLIDRPAQLIVDHVNPRNSWNFSSRRAYVEKPDAWICKFQDEGNDFKEAQRIIRRPGFIGDIKLTETIELPGLTNPTVIYREGLRRFYEAEHRPDVYEAIQEGSVRVATRGDSVMLSHDVLSRSQWAGRVRSKNGNLVELDEAVTMLAGKSYAVRFRHFASENDTIGTSVVRAVETFPGETTILSMKGTGAQPMARDIVHFGEMGTDSYQVVVSQVEQTEDQCSIIRAIDASPIIDTLTDAAVIPAWSSRVGAEINENTLQPSAPRFTSITSGVKGTDRSGIITYLIEQGSGGITATQFRVEHRLGTSGNWTVTTIPAANGGGTISAYHQGNTIQMRARALSFTGATGPYNTEITVIIGSDDAPIPQALDVNAISITPLFGGALIQLATGSDTNTKRIQVYRSTAAVLDRETDAVGQPYMVNTQQSFSFALGDTTRSTLINGGAMDSATVWTIDPDWTIASGKATHIPGTTGIIEQAIAVTSGQWYRFGYSVEGGSAGSLTPRLNGGSPRAGTSVLTNGRKLDRIQAVTGNNVIQFEANNAFDGSLDDVVAYLETAACLSQGIHYVWIEPQNADGVHGPISGPFTIEIV